jgi:hypothetical protein
MKSARDQHRSVGWEADGLPRWHRLASPQSSKGPQRGRHSCRHPAPAPCSVMAVPHRTRRQQLLSAAAPLPSIPSQPLSRELACRVRGWLTAQRPSALRRQRDDKPDLAPTAHTDQDWPKDPGTPQLTGCRRGWEGSSSALHHATEPELASTGGCRSVGKSLAACPGRSSRGSSAGTHCRRSRHSGACTWGTSDECSTHSAAELCPCSSSCDACQTCCHRRSAMAHSTRHRRTAWGSLATVAPRVCAAPLAQGAAEWPIDDAPGRPEPAHCGTAGGSPAVSAHTPPEDRWCLRLLLPAPRSRL